MRSDIPTRTFNEESIDVTPSLRSTLNVQVRAIVSNVVPERYLVNSDYVLSCIVLQHSSDKRLREEEPRNPEVIGSAIIDPVLEERNAIVEILCPRRERFQREESLLRPHLGHLVIEKRVR